MTSVKHTQRRKPATPLLIAPLGNETGSVPFSNEELQGPSPVDYELELKAKFLPKMVLEMQEGVACKARRMVIGRTFDDKPTIKALQDYLKLHLPTFFESATLLTQGFFDVLFVNEKKAKAIRKITTVEWNGLNLSFSTTMEWSGLNLSFSKYIPNFDTNTQGAKTLLSHTIKV